MPTDSSGAWRSLPSEVPRRIECFKEPMMLDPIGADCDPIMEIGTLIFPQCLRIEE